MWSEWVPNVERLEYQVYPRLAAYAEVGWTALENKDYSSFKERMKSQLERWDIQGIGYARDQVAKLSAQDFFNHHKIDSWNPAATPADWSEVDFSTDGQFDTAGEYEVAFVYQKGTHALDISAVALLENGAQIARDEHVGFAGNNMRGIVYTLKLPKVKPGASYTLRARVKGNGGTDSHGEIKIQSGK
jgi:hexosaminidase